MMQQLLTTSRQLTLGAYKHETECKCNEFIILKNNMFRSGERIVCLVTITFFSFRYIYVNLSVAKKQDVSYYRRCMKAISHCSQSRPTLRKVKDSLSQSLKYCLSFIP